MVNSTYLVVAGVDKPMRNSKNIEAPIFIASVISIFFSFLSQSLNGINHRKPSKVLQIPASWPRAKYDSANKKKHIDSPQLIIGSQFVC